MPLMKVYKNIGGYFRQFQAFVINRMVPPDITEKDSLTYWRVRILFAILFGGLMLCVFALILSITLVIRERLWGLGVLMCVRM